MIDFVDNANMFNMPYSLHRVLDIAKYQPMAYVLAPENKRKLDQDMLFQGEKPEAWLDVPIDVSDYEIIDLFNWQNSVKDMISQIEFVRMVDVQSETVERYIKDGKVKPDLSIPFGDKRMFHYFREESIRNPRASSAKLRVAEKTGGAEATPPPVAHGESSARRSDHE